MVYTKKSIPIEPGAKKLVRYNRTPGDKRRLCIIFFVGVFMGQSMTVDAQASGLTPEYLAEIISETRSKFNVPAIVVTTMNSQSILLQEVQGVRVADRPERATLDDYFHIGSCAKSMLAVMAAKQIEQNKISWNTRFFDVFPKLKQHADNAYAEITLEDLFLCQAGIKAFTQAGVDLFPEIDSAASDRRLEFVRYLLQQPPATKKKGRKFQFLYSNASYTMAAVMLEKVSGMRYEELMRKTLSDDLGMSVHIGWPNRISSEQPWGHQITGRKIESFAPDHQYQLPDLLLPAGDLSMTPKDFAAYTQLHLQGLRGQDAYLSSNSIRYINFSHKGFSLGVGNGVMLGVEYSGFDGSTGTFFCRSIIIPDSDFAFTVMTNAGSGTGTMKAVDWLSQRIVAKQMNLGWWQRMWIWLGW